MHSTEQLIAAFGAGALIAAVIVLALVFRRASTIRGTSLALSRATLKGKIAEQMAPLFADFPFDAEDARFLGAPVDYVVFEGYSAGADVEVVLVEVKTGRARLSEGEKRIQRAIDEGRVRYEILRL